MHATLPLLEVTSFPRLRRGPLETLQVNLGYRCNQSCLHCHVNASPRRREVMDRKTVDRVLQFLDVSPIHTLDITGGAPELNPHFRYLVEQAHSRGLRIIDRCNLTILEEPEHSDLADFLAGHGVEIVASLPCYLEENVNAQRGHGVFEASIRGLQRLNRLGYGDPDGTLVVSLVYNPQGPTLPPPQCRLEQDYKRELQARYQVRFNRLLTLANMPIGRFGSTLISRGQFAEYMALLRAAYSAANLGSVMCRTLISIDWQGYVYDCDFNQMLGLALRGGASRGTHITDLTGVDLSGQDVVVRDHCYGCTAGQGSSCQGALR
nr:arsenosugar biosynthesis radical SAM protein ArsS [Gammaproteobacteria bacterium]